MNGIEIGVSIRVSNSKIDRISDIYRWFMLRRIGTIIWRILIEYCTDNRVLSIPVRFQLISACLLEAIWRNLMLPGITYK